MPGIVRRHVRRAGILSAAALLGALLSAPPASADPSSPAPQPSTTPTPAMTGTATASSTATPTATATPRATAQGTATPTPVFSANPSPSAGGPQAAPSGTASPTPQPTLSSPPRSASPSPGPSTGPRRQTNAIGVAGPCDPGSVCRQELDAVNRFLQNSNIGNCGSVPLCDQALQLLLNELNQPAPCSQPDLCTSITDIAGRAVVFAEAVVNDCVSFNNATCRTARDLTFQELALVLQAVETCAGGTNDTCNAVVGLVGQLLNSLKGLAVACVQFNDPTCATARDLALQEAAFVVQAAQTCASGTNATCTTAENLVTALLTVVLTVVNDCKSETTAICATSLGLARSLENELLGLPGFAKQFAIECVGGTNPTCEAGKSLALGLVASVQRAVNDCLSETTAACQTALELEKALVGQIFTDAQFAKQFAIECAGGTNTTCEAGKSLVFGLIQACLAGTTPACAAVQQLVNQVAQDAQGCVQGAANNSLPTLPVTSGVAVQPDNLGCAAKVQTAEQLLGQLLSLVVSTEQACLAGTTPACATAQQLVNNAIAVVQACATLQDQTCGTLVQTGEQEVAVAAGLVAACANGQNATCQGAINSVDGIIAAITSGLTPLITCASTTPAACDQDAVVAAEVLIAGIAQYGCLALLPGQDIQAALDQPNVICVLLAPGTYVVSKNLELPDGKILTGIPGLESLTVIQAERKIAWGVQGGLIKKARTGLTGIVNQILATLAPPPMEYDTVVASLANVTVDGNDSHDPAFQSDASHVGPLNGNADGAVIGISAPSMDVSRVTVVNVRCDGIQTYEDRLFQNSPIVAHQLTTALTDILVQNGGDECTRGHAPPGSAIYIIQSGRPTARVIIIRLQVPAFTGLPVDLLDTYSGGAIIGSTLRADESTYAGISMLNSANWTIIGNTVTASYSPYRKNSPDCNTQLVQASGADALLVCAAGTGSITGLTVSDNTFIGRIGILATTDTSSSHGGNSFTRNNVKGSVIGCLDGSSGQDSWANNNCRGGTYPAADEGPGVIPNGS